MIAAKDREIIRELASKWMEYASKPIMNERKRLWRNLHDLQPERPVILIETSTIDGYVASEELLCKDPFLRAVERNMRDTLRHAEEVGDDIVIEPYFRIGWQLKISDFGVPVEVRPITKQQNEPSIAYTFNFPIKKPGDIRKLKKRSIAVNRQKTNYFKTMLEDIMGDTLPVKVANYDPF